MSSGFMHGDVCLAPAYDCGVHTNLVCVVDRPSDAQGVCRLVCGTFSDCLNNAAAHGHFDNECCKIQNGTRVCGQSSNFPVGACS
jgi:hypothetical protein